MNELSLEELVTRVRVTHHVTTRSLLRSLHDAIDLVAEGATRADAPKVDALRRTFAYFRDDLLAHLVSEERIVFPYIIALEQAVEGRAPRPRAPFRSIASPVRVMENEQEAAREAVARLETAIFAARPRTQDPRWDAIDADLAALATDLALHTHVEQHEVFPRAVAAEQTLLTRRLQVIAATSRR